MIYFDNASTTKPSAEILKNVLLNIEQDYANPSSLHSLGFSVERKIKESKMLFAKYLGVNYDEIYFTSGGTESNNLAIQGVLNARFRTHNHIITVKTEHPSVKMTVAAFEQKGFEIDYINVDGKGYIEKSHLKELIKENTSIVSVMDTNNETGTIQDIEEIGKIIKEKNKDTMFHVDGVQAFGKKAIQLKYVDLLSFSGHKIHSLGGIGGLYIKKRTKINPMLFGGSQQNSVRPGTENVIGILAFTDATKRCFESMQARSHHVNTLRNRLLQIKDRIEAVYVNSDEENGSPYILNISFLGIKSEVLLHSLESDNIYVGTGSACSGKSDSVLKYMGHTEDIYGSAIRFSFCHENTIEEVDTCILSLEKYVEFLRKFKRR